MDIVYRGEQLLSSDPYHVRYDTNWLFCVLIFVVRLHNFHTSLWETVGLRTFFPTHVSPKGGIEMFKLCSSNFDVRSLPTFRMQE